MNAPVVGHHDHMHTIFLPQSRRIFLKLTTYPIERGSLIYTYVPVHVQFSTPICHTASPGANSFYFSHYSLGLKMHSVIAGPEDRPGLPGVSPTFKTSDETLFFSGRRLGLFFSPLLGRFFGGNGIWGISQNANEAKKKKSRLQVDHQTMCEHCTLYSRTKMLIC